MNVIRKKCFQEPTPISGSSAWNPTGKQLLDLLREAASNREQAQVESTPQSATWEHSSRKRPRNSADSGPQEVTPEGCFFFLFCFFCDLLVNWPLLHSFVHSLVHSPTHAFVLPFHPTNVMNDQMLLTHVKKTRILTKNNSCGGKKETKTRHLRKDWNTIIVWKDAPAMDLFFVWFCRFAPSLWFLQRTFSAMQVCFLYFFQTMPYPCCLGLSFSFVQL